MKTRRLISLLLCAVLLGSLFTAEAAAAAVPEWAIDDGTPETAALQVALPAKYDLRDEGLVTPVKNQGPWGSCWAFGGIAAAETAILSAYGMTYEQSKLDLSERHLAYFALQPVTEEIEPSQVGEGLHPFDPSPNAAFDAGGMGIYVTTLFSQGTGPVPEAAFPYRGANATLSLQYFDEHPDEETMAQVGMYAQSLGMTAEQILQQWADAAGISVEEQFAKCKDDVRAAYAKNPTYSAHDDWFIPASGESGQPNRLLTGGVVLKDGNVLPGYLNADGTPNQSCLNAMKQELVNGRAVSIAYYADQSGTYTMTDDAGGVAYNQYIDQPLGIDHAVCIVGYDDNYPAENFKQPTPPGNGAWIVKNSWGSTADAAPDDLGNTVNYGEYGIKNAAGEYTGYFYLSYYDKTISNAETMTFTANLNSGKGFYALQYDYIPAQFGFYATDFADTPVSSANVFTAEDTMEIRSVSTRTYEDNMRVTFAIYGLNEDAKAPTDGVLLYRSSCNFERAGFHRLDLEQPITVGKDKKISVVSTTSVLDEEGKRLYNVSANRGMTAQEATNYGFLCYAAAVVNAGESFVYKDGSWTDWKDYLAENAGGAAVDNFSIKVYAVPVTPASEYLPGDLNHDGYVNAKDVTFLRRFLAGGYGVTLE